MQSRGKSGEVDTPHPPRPHARLGSLRSLRFGELALARTRTRAPARTCRCQLWQLPRFVTANIREDSRAGASRAGTTALVGKLVVETEGNLDGGLRKRERHPAADH